MTVYIVTLNNRIVATFNSLTLADFFVVDHGWKEVAFEGDWNIVEQKVIGA